MGGRGASARRRREGGREGGKAGRHMDATCTGTEALKDRTWSPPHCEVGSLLQQFATWNAAMHAVASASSASPRKVSATEVSKRCRNRQQGRVRKKGSEKSASEADRFAAGSQQKRTGHVRFHSEIVHAPVRHGAGQVVCEKIQNI